MSKTAVWSRSMASLFSVSAGPDGQLRMRELHAVDRSHCVLCLFSDQPERCLPCQECRSGSNARLRPGALEDVGAWLQDVFGKVETTGGGPTYTHTFKVGEGV